MAETTYHEHDDACECGNGDYCTDCNYTDLICNNSDNP